MEHLESDSAVDFGEDKPMITNRPKTITVLYSKIRYLCLYYSINVSLNCERVPRFILSPKQLPGISLGKKSVPLVLRCCWINHPISLLGLTPPNLPHDTCGPVAGPNPLCHTSGWPSSFTWRTRKGEI